MNKLLRPFNDAAAILVAVADLGIYWLVKLLPYWPGLLLLAVGLLGLVGLLSLAAQLL